MPTSANKELVGSFFRAIDSGDLAALDNVCAPAYVLHFPGTPGPLNLDNTKGLFGGFIAGFANLRHKIDHAVAEDDAVAVRLTIMGTHQGELNGIPPTGKDVAMTSLNIFHLRDGKIVEQWVEYDALGMLAQLGVMPGSGPA